MAVNDGWYVCKVDATGPIENAGAYVMLTDTGGKFSNTWIYVPLQIATMVNETAIACVQGPYNAFVYISGNTIGRFHLLA